MAKKFTGGYVRGGVSTLWLSRDDIVEALAMLKIQHFDLREITREANERVAQTKEEKEKRTA